MIPTPSHPRITTAYGKRGSAWASGVHGGADFAAPSGTEVVAPWSGTVVESGRTSWGGAYGTAVIIDFDRLPGDKPGLWGIFAHLSSTSVKPGQRVAAGAAIGKVGSTGNSSGPHLHFEVQRDRRWRSGNHVDPQPWIDATKEDIMSFEYGYSGKPSGTLKVGQSYVNLDIDEFDPRKAGLEFVMTYLNCSGFVFTGGQPGRIRICFERDPNNSDRFGYQDYTVVPGQQELLITHATFEKGDGTRTWTQIKCMDGLQSMTIGTRYMKRAVLT